MKPLNGSIVDRNEGLSEVNESGTLVIHMGLYSVFTGSSHLGGKKLGRPKGSITTAAIARAIGCSGVP